MKYATLGFLLFSFVGIAQSNQGIDIDSLLRGNEQVPKTLLVGSWHFNYPGLDAHKAEDDLKINIYSDKRQAELKELLDYISVFKPTKILVESGANTGYLQHNYREYEKGNEELYASERSQIGMRLANRFALDTIYGVNAWSMGWHLSEKRDSTMTKTYTDSIYDRHYYGGNDEISQRYNRWYRYKDEQEVKRTLLESFKNMNSEKELDRGFGGYLAGGQFESENFEGPDALSIIWFNRNLRIFKNIKDIDYNEEDRILVLFGAGHVSILRWLFQCTPEFELVPFNSLEK
jgi:hypothetical protein